MLFSFSQVGPAAATMNWQLGIDHDDNSCHLFYWHGPNGSWVWLAANDGGREPPVEQTNVKAAFDVNGDVENVSFLIVGYTPAPAEDWIQCDVCDINYSE